MIGLWRTWINLWCWSVVLFGIVLALGAFPPTDASVRALYALIGGGGLAPGYLDAPGMRFTCGVLGAVSIGWGATIMAMVRAADSGGAPVWRALTFAMVLWYAIDCPISALTGFPLNIVPNTVLIAGYLIPVLASGVLRARAAAA